MIGRIASSPKQAVSLPFRNILMKSSLTQWWGGLVSGLAGLAGLVTSWLRGTGACTMFFEELLLLPQNRQGKKEGEGVCQCGIDHVWKKCVILLQVCLKSQPSCTLVFVASQQGAVWDGMGGNLEPATKYKLHHLWSSPGTQNNFFLVYSPLEENANLLLTWPVLIILQCWLRCGSW